MNKRLSGNIIFVFSIFVFVDRKVIGCIAARKVSNECNRCICSKLVV